jgi:hypothetical protein
VVLLRFILAEFKYNESYSRSGHTRRSDGTDRMAPYRELFYREDSPINTDIALPIEAFVAEPFYQLLRYQLLARQVEVRKADVIDSASILYVYVPENRKLRRVVVPEFRQLGTDVFAVRSRLLVDSDQFMPMTLAAMLRPMLSDPPPSLAGWPVYVHERYPSVFAR